MNPPLPAGGADVPGHDLPTPPPMPSIAASALLESRLLIDRTRRVLLAWLARD